jgi:RNA polymerase sigma-32 factor
MAASTTNSATQPSQKPSQYWRALELAARRGGMLSRAEESRLAQSARQGDAAAFDRLVCAHIPLVFAIAHEFRSYGLSPDELVSEGLLGLVKAARDFDPRHGTRLATYAAWWIRARIRSFTVNNRRIVRGSSTRAARKLMSRLRRTERELSQAQGSWPDDAAVAAALNVRTDDVEEMRAFLGGRDAAYGIEVDGTAAAIAANTPSPEVLAIEADNRRVAAELLHEALAGLDARARRVIERRYLSERESTFGDLSDELGVSRERVRQIEAQAKASVRNAIAAPPF